MRFGVVILPEHRWPVARDLWRRVEELGFDHAWTYDHLAWGVLRDEPWFGAVPTLTAAAAVTSTIRLGTLVASPNFRHPVSFARELLALDDVSGGRFTLGIGAGGTGWDATMLGQEPWSPGERSERFAEVVELLDRLLTSPTSATTWKGRHYEAVDVPMAPGCVQQPRLPFAVAATGPKGMRLAARFGQTWVTNGERTHDGPPLPAAEGAAVVAAQAARLNAACVERRRDPASVGRLVLAGLRLDSGTSSPEHLRDTVGRYEEVGVTDFVVYWPRPTPPYEGDLDRFESVMATVLAP